MEVLGRMFTNLGPSFCLQGTTCKEDFSLGMGILRITSFFFLDAGITAFVLVVRVASDEASLTRHESEMVWLPKTVATTPVLVAARRVL